MAFSESTNWHDALAPGEELGKAERQLDAAISDITGGGVNTSGLQVIFISTSSGTVASTADEGSVVGSSGVGSVNLPAGFFASGVTLRFTARGYYSSAAGTANLRMRVKLDSNILVNTGDFAPPTATNRYWEISGLITCQEAGTSGEVMTNAHMSLFDGDGQGMVTATVGTINTEDGLTFDLTADWDTADASNKIVCTNLVLEKLQVGNASISPDDVTVEFQSATSTATTNAETHEVSVILLVPSGGQIAAPVTVDWSATNVQGVTSGTVTFAVGSGNNSSQLIEIELDYTLGNPQITLSNASSNSTLGSETQHTVTIGWVHTFKFNETSGSEINTSYGDGGFTTVVGRGVHQSGVGWVADISDSPNQVDHQVQIQRTFASMTISELRMIYSRSNGEGVGPSFTSQTYRGPAWAWVAAGDSPGYDGEILQGRDSEETNYNLAVTPGSYTVTGIRLRAISGYADPGPPDPTGSATITTCVVNGSGVNPFA